MALFILGIVTGILCGLWSEMATALQLLTWAGFAGCTTYFAFNEHGFKGIKMTVLCNLAGVASGMLLIYLSSIISFSYSAGILCCLVTVMMCWLGYIRYIAFIPGIFMGCFSTFAANGAWVVLVVSMICGAILGYLCDFLGTWLYKVFSEKKGTVHSEEGTVHSEV